MEPIVSADAPSRKRRRQSAKLSTFDNIGDSDGDSTLHVQLASISRVNTVVRATVVDHVGQSSQVAFFSNTGGEFHVWAEKHLGSRVRFTHVRPKVCTFAYKSFTHRLEFKATERTRFAVEGEVDVREVEFPSLRSCVGSRVSFVAFVASEEGEKATFMGKDYIEYSISDETSKCFLLTTKSFDITLFDTVRIKKGFVMKEKSIYVVVDDFAEITSTPYDEDDDLFDVVDLKAL
uniref:Late transcription factor 1 n=1 Tax=Steinernema glaseri TaxID=37863 RepID=A0A1I8AU29_9BILA